MRRTKLEVFVYGKDAVGKYFDPLFHKKFVLEMERSVLVRSLGKEVLVRVYSLPSRKLYLGIVFLDGLVRDGLTVIREAKRDGYYPVGYIDEVGHNEVLSHSLKGVFMKVSNLKSFRDRDDMPIKTDNVDPLDADIYWNLLDLGENASQEELEPFLEIRTKMGVVHFYLLRREGRDNIDLYIGVNPKDRKILVQGKAGETYLVDKAEIPQVVSLEQAVRFLQKVSENFGIEEAIVLDEKTYARTGLSFHLSGIAKMVA